jgi:bifunctional DNA primase/polymerase-like protein/primase-like protein
MAEAYHSRHELEPPAPDRGFLAKAARAYAKRDIPVFPCKPGGKEPLTERGHLDATTDLRRITAWWTRWPEANVAAPTGERSGVWVLDADPEDGGLESLKALGLRLGRANVKSGGGGLHFAFRWNAAAPPIRNSAGKLGPGLDVRGEGGYVLLPPSRTEAAYETLRRGVRDAPEKLLELLREPEPSRPEGGARRPSNINLEDVSTIRRGERNDTLTRIAGRLHDGTRTLDELVRDLMAVNEARCAPPLPKEEGRRIARSIYGRGPCTSGPGPGARKRLQEIEAAVFEAPWPGMGGKTERDVTVAAIKIARKHCREHKEGGVEVSIDVRSLALAAAISKATLTRRGGALDRLEAAGWLRRGQPGSGRKAGTFILSNPRAKLTHSLHAVSYPVRSGSTLRAARLRWSSVTREWVAGDYETVVRLRLGKTCGAVVDVLEREGGSATMAEIARILGLKRPRDLRRRVISRLEERGIVTVSGDAVALGADWLEALDREREASGEIAAYRRDLARYNRERAAYHALRERGRLLTREERRERARVASEERREARRAAWEVRHRLIRDADRAAPNARLWAERREALARELEQAR